MRSRAVGGAQTGPLCASAVDGVAWVKGAEEGSEGCDGGGYDREFEDRFGDDVGDDAGKSWVGVLLRREIEEADGDEGKESVAG